MAGTEPIAVYTEFVLSVVPVPLAAADVGLQGAYDSAFSIIHGSDPPAGANVLLGREKKGSAPLGNKLYVGNLSFGTTEAVVRELFGQFGELVSVTLPADRLTGRPRGFGFVEFASSEAAAAATQKLEGYSLEGRNIRVNEATDRPAGGGYGRPGGFNGGNGDRGSRPSRPKGSRRNVRARKRSIW